MSSADQVQDHSDQEVEATRDLLRTSDVAALFQVSPRTVSEWARRGRVPCMRTPGGQWRYPAEPIRRLFNRVGPAPWEET
ncbi:MAG: helix-turn-helix domain-containing protein [Actinomycetota bacterium]|nr:helix-turn-helix domain-containing protein [Actinomycetota bacterium]